MTIAAVMVYVDAGQQEAGAICVARGVAERFGASLIGASALAVEPPFIAEGVVIRDTTAEDLARMKATLAGCESWFRDKAGMPADRVSWRWGLDYPTSFLAREARAADLVVVTREQSGAEDRALQPAEAILRSGRPALSVPAGCSELRGRKVIVGWKDTREARRAVHDALPLLVKADSVSVIEICLSSEQDDARRRTRDVAGYLARHGVASRSEVRVHMAETDADQLIRLAAEDGADLVVTGAYGHSRLGEWMFGGMTRDLLRNAPCCLLMSH